MSRESENGAGSGISATVMTTGSPVLWAVGAARLRQVGYRCAEGVVRTLDVVRVVAGGREVRGLFLAAVRVHSDRLPLSVWVWHPNCLVSLLEQVVILHGIDRLPVERQLPGRRRWSAGCGCRRCKAISAIGIGTFALLFRHGAGPVAAAVRDLLGAFGPDVTGPDVTADLPTVPR